MYEASELMKKNSFHRYDHENGMKIEIQTNSTETWVGINFCGGVHENPFVCIALTGPQRSKTIKLRETLSVFCFLLPKTIKKQ